MFTVDPLTFIISVPQTDLTLISGTIYEMDTESFRDDLKAWEASLEGIVFTRTHDHNTEATIAGTTYARGIQIIDPYSIEFQDGQYTCILKGSNNRYIQVTYSFEGLEYIRRDSDAVVSLFVLLIIILCIAVCLFMVIMLRGGIN